MKTLIGAEVTLNVDDEEAGGSITSLKWNNKEFVLSTRKAYGLRWLGFMDGQELSQTNIKISATRDGFQRSNKGHAITLPIGSPPPIDDTDPITKAIILQSGTDFIDLRFSPEDPGSGTSVVEYVRSRVSIGFTGNPHIIRFETQVETQLDTSGVDIASANASAILGIPGATHIPHTILGGPVLYTPDEVTDQAYIFDTGTRSRTVRNDEEEELPVDGGPVVGSGDGKFCIGIYQFTPTFPTKGFFNNRVRWRKDTDLEGTNWNELSVGENSANGTPTYKGSHTRDYFVVVGTADDVEAGMILLHNYFTMRRKRNDRLLLGSAIQQGTIKV